MSRLRVTLMTVYLSLGANLGNREETIDKALNLLSEQVGTLIRRSSFFYSEPWGFESPNEFCNLCAAFETDLSPLDLLRTTQAIERALGRSHKSKIINQESKMYTDRCIDIDIIRAFNNDGEEIKCEIIDHKSKTSSAPLLAIPHRLWRERDFVTIPLAEILQ